MFITTIINSRFVNGNSSVVVDDVVLMLSGVIVEDIAGVEVSCIAGVGDIFNVVAVGVKDAVDI